MTIIMRYFLNTAQNQVYGYDQTQTALIDAATTAGWPEITGSWPPPAPAPTLASLASAAVSSGLTITLTGTVTLAATLFPTDSTTQTKLAAVVTLINATGGFPNGVETYPMKDASGAWNQFTVGQYTAVSGAIATYVSALYLIIDGNPMNATALPSNSVSLTV